MKEKMLQEKINELVEVFGSIPPQQKKKFVYFAKARDKEQKSNASATLHTINSSLDYLRICLKYIIFDLEATKRENKYLKKLLDEKGK